MLAGWSVISMLFTSSTDVRRDCDMLEKCGRIGENRTRLLSGDWEKERSGGAWGLKLSVWSDGYRLELRFASTLFNLASICCRSICTTPCESALEVVNVSFSAICTSRAVSRLSTVSLVRERGLRAASILEQHPRIHEQMEQGWVLVESCVLNLIRRFKKA